MLFRSPDIQDAIASVLQQNRGAINYEPHEIVIMWEPEGGPRSERRDWPLFWMAWAINLRAPK